MCGSTDRYSSLAVAVAVDLGPRLAKLRMLAGRPGDAPACGRARRRCRRGGPRELGPQDVSAIADETLGPAFDKVEDHFRFPQWLLHKAVSEMLLRDRRDGRESDWV
jgi:hypothetical protein